jgi:hypothetical protein
VMLQVRSICVRRSSIFYIWLLLLPICSRCYPDNCHTINWKGILKFCSNLIRVCVLRVRHS